MPYFLKTSLLAAALMTTSCSQGNKNSAHPAGADNTQNVEKQGNTAPIPVTVVAASSQNVPVYAAAPGTVAAMNTVTINPQVSGQLISLHFREGESVKKGQLLAEIDARALQASYDQAAAAKRQNQALLATARANYTRSSTLEYQPYVAKTELDTQYNQVTQYEAAVAANEAAMRAAQVQLQYTKIVAPIDGVAGIRSIDAGNVVTTSTSIVTLTQMHPIYVSFNLPERLLQEVRQAHASGPVMVAALDRGDAHPLTEDGTLDAINNQINTDSGTFSARAVFSNRNNALWPGQFVNARLQLRTIANGVVIPAQAVQRGPNGDYVYLVKPDHTVVTREVTQGVEIGDSHVQIAKGLNVGDTVVTEGQFRLKPGSKVIALAPGETPPAPTEAELKAAAEKRSKNSMGGPPRGGP
ncbi:efflux RND transporter periplasmic adaptor subunit [Xylella fastidiosa subsp. multiplex]|uniref:Efflux RND transporter periplasmic adaptor subunit n=1 Tax=Xylella fastidiosa subsp. multiplex TaxID=644357 RepID=A0A9Q4MHN8_XYLFS|nr:efflux RND transporter periplasmic adaptor subunit [Xylella fastidiosa]KAJ4852177.1 efflux RND transporter periplasmic adaptor subunit [Xylella fastidiosa subsp. multiplex]KFA42084.1 membrane fusion protein [Xylella fastidiosa]MBE0269027.1 efflux RND transporter periplasmic adaptor subunit [Xylella fastidiosa subsp. multiplex]MBE0275755.1 efflux RND transporter periplasmic adaptor subunit [Xylella fastidiosa subsp. multiplex]MBE0277910.1 efflux RND transporter periplasmic adaptor subunit [X